MIVNGEIEGLLVGHWTDSDAATGCTVIRLPPQTVASGEVRGGAPATREFALLDPARLVSSVDAVVLSGGSAFGLRACDGVVDALRAEGVGFPTSVGVVPIVVGMSLFDLGVGSPDAWPNAAAGAAAFAAASATPAVGRVGAGTGATVNKWRGSQAVTPGGVGIVTLTEGDLTLTAIVAVNAAGEIDDGAAVAAVRDGSFRWSPPERFGETNTVIGAVVTNATLTKMECHLVAQGAHDGLARAVAPSHMRSDGDAFVAAATAQVSDVDIDHVRWLAVVATEQAIRSGVATLDSMPPSPDPSS